MSSAGIATKTSYDSAMPRMRIAQIAPFTNASRRSFTAAPSAPSRTSPRNWYAAVMT